MIGYSLKLIIVPYKFSTYTKIPLNAVFVEQIVSLINSTCIEDDGFTTTQKVSAYTDL